MAVQVIHSIRVCCLGIDMKENGRLMVAASSPLRTAVRSPALSFTNLVPLSFSRPLLLLHSSVTLHSQQTSISFHE